MKGLIHKLAVAVGVMGLALALPASAFAGTITIGGYTFYDHATPDALLESAGDWYDQGDDLITTDSALLAAIQGPDLTTYARSATPGAYVKIEFDPPVLANGPGADLYIFSVGPIPDDSTQVTVTVDMFDQARVFGLTEIVTSGPEDIGVFAINLTAFGDASSLNPMLKALAKDGTGDPVDWMTFPTVQIGLKMNILTGFGPSLAAIASKNTADGTAPTEAVPEPTTLALLGIGLAGVVGVRRMRGRE
jgi:hypothetical protein